MTPINNQEDIIDSRDVIARIEELHEDIASLTDDTGCTRADLDEELAALESLQDDAAPYAPDWEHGEALIRDSYFKQYAKGLAEDLDLIPDNGAWPAYCIDWERAARELQMDYTQVEFDGVTYWIR